MVSTTQWTGRFFPGTEKKRTGRIIHFPFSMILRFTPPYLFLFFVYYRLKLSYFFSFLTLSPLLVTRGSGSWKILCPVEYNRAGFPTILSGFPDNGYVSRYQDLNSTRVQMIRGTLKIAWKREVSNSRAKHMQIHSSIPRQ